VTDVIERCGLTSVGRMRSKTIDILISALLSQSLQWRNHGGAENDGHENAGHVSGV